LPAPQTKLSWESIRFSAQSIRNSYCKPRSAIGWFRFHAGLKQGIDAVK
jgi:hypothetical protein